MPISSLASNSRPDSPRSGCAALGLWRQTLNLFGCSEKWFSARKGYGFVSSSQVEEQDEIFVHHSSIVSPDGMFRTLVRVCIEVDFTQLQP
jgi:cold shock CspA family protein